MEELSIEHCLQVLEDGWVGHLGVVSEGEPYVAPVSYVVLDGLVGFKTGPGRRAEAIRLSPRVCLETSHVDQSTGYWESVVVWGDAREITDPVATQEVISALISKYRPILGSPLSHGPNDVGLGEPDIVIGLPIETITGRTSGSFFHVRDSTRPSVTSSSSARSTSALVGRRTEQVTAAIRGESAVRGVGDNGCALCREPLPPKRSGVFARYPRIDDVGDLGLWLLAESQSMTHIGVLTAGGDCPGLNAAIRGVVGRATAEGHSVFGIEDGWQGLMGGRVRPLGRDDVRGILTRGGTILGTSRTDPYVHGDGLASLMPALTATGIDSVVVIGGDGSLRTAARLAEEGLSVVGVPKTIDNDIEGTEVSFGFDTAVQIVTDAIDRLTTTAEAHNRIMVVEVMGRQSGWIAVHAGLAGGAEAILVPEEDYDLDDLAQRLLVRHNSGRAYSIVIVAEGVSGPSGGHVTMGIDHVGFERLGGVSAVVAAELEVRTGYETRVMILGHLQRGGTPSAFDRVLATRMGIRAAEATINGDHGTMVASVGPDVVLVPLSSAVAVPRVVPSRRLAELAWFSV